MIEYPRILDITYSMMAYMLGSVVAIITFKLILKDKFMLKSIFGIKQNVTSIAIDKETSILLEVTKKRKEVEMDLEQLSLKLANERQAQTFAMDKVKHEHDLQLKRAKEDLQRLKDQSIEDSGRLTRRLESKHELKIDEMTTLLALDKKQDLLDMKAEHTSEIRDLVKKHEDEITKMNIDNVKELANIKANNAESIAATKVKIAEEFYEKAQELTKNLTIHGSAQSKFVQDLALKMADKQILPASLHTTITTNTDSEVK